MTTTTSIRFYFISLLGSIFLLTQTSCDSVKEEAKADLIIHNAQVYTLSWSDPDKEGMPGEDAPFKDGKWNQDAEAVAIRGNKLLFIGETEKALSYKGETTQVIDAEGAVLLPGLIDSHTHPFGFGANLGKVDLTNLKDKELIVQTLKEQVDPKLKKGDWILGFGYDEGNLSTEALPTSELLSTHFPDNPVYLVGAHGFSAVANQLAMDLAGINSGSKAPVGGEIVKDAKGKPMGIFLNNASGLVGEALPEKNLDDYKEIGLYGLDVMAKSGFTAIHDAGMGRTNYEAYQALEDEGKLPIRVYGMIRVTDTSLVQQLKQHGPDQDMSEMFVVRSVKAYYDGSLGIRGARMIEDYSDKVGHKGVSGEAYGYDEDLVAEMMNLGYQVGVHAIGDAGNREVLDFYERVYEKHPDARKNRNRIEHAQVVHPDDFDRFKSLDLIASMEPPIWQKTWIGRKIGWEENASKEPMPADHAAKGSSHYL